jgi:TRAP-type C4-dicarboxylate transport system permease large subunit
MQSGEHVRYPLVILDQAPKTGLPGKGAFSYPASGQQHKATLGVIHFDDLQLDPVLLRSLLGCVASVALIDKDQFHLLAGRLLHRLGQLGHLGPILRDTAATTASITLILGASGLLAWILAREQVPHAVANAMLGLTDNPIVFLLLVNVLLIFLGAVLEGISVLVITVPILLPIAVQFGVDPLHFGVIAIINLMIGLLTPPIGAVLYVMSPVTRMPVHEVFRGAAPFLIPLLAVLLLVTFVPDIVLFLPGLLDL